MPTAVTRPKPLRAPKRSEQGEQVRQLREALVGTVIDPSLPYTAQVFRALKEAILSLRLLPRTPLSEAAISEVLGLSRTPVREALKDLSAENLIDIYPQAGTVVAPIRMKLIEHGVFVRDALESANLLDLMRRLDAAGRIRIERQLEAQKQAIATLDYSEFLLHDESLHRLFFKLTDRLPVWVIVSQAKQHVDRARRVLTKDNFAICQRAYAEHLNIVRALFEGDEAVLRSSLHQHVVDVTSAVLDYADRTHSNSFVD